MRVARVLLQSSAYSVGLAYEMLVLNVLQKHNFQLMHTGGAGDGGQDFNGFWVLPNKTVPVVGQCKCFSKPIGPVDVREFEDVLFRKFVALDEPRRQSISGYIGMIVSKSWFTPSALKTFHSSRLPVILSQVLPSLSSGAGGCGPLKEQDELKADHSKYEKIDSRFEHSTDPVKGTRGFVNDFVLNKEAQSVLGRVQVVWRQGSAGELRTFNRRHLSLLVNNQA